MKGGGGKKTNFIAFLRAIILLHIVLQFSADIAKQTRY